MTQKWCDVRVFISSTFRDMDAERDMLVKRVFPQLRERLLPYRIHLIDIDLRWGITPEEAENDRVLDLCLEQIDVCRPFFLGILGERYGWVPNRIMLPEKPEYGWIQGMTGKSVTELEILYGVLRNPQMANHAFFFFREPGALDNVPADALAEYRDSGDNAKKLRALKGDINDSPYRVTPYGAAWDDARQRLTGLDAFADAVLEQLWLGVKAAHQLPDTPPVFDDNPLEQERDFHDRFIESRSRVYIGRESTTEALRRFVEDDGTAPCLVTGPSGSGKSAALAKFVSDYRLQHPDVFVLPHFIGASPRSTGLRDMLRRLCEELRNAFQFTDTIEREGQPPEIVPAEIPFDLNPLVNRFKEFIEKAGKNRDCPKRSEERAQTELSQDFSNNQEDIGPISKAGTVPSPSQARSLGTVPVFSRVLLFLDALNQLDETDNAHTLFWLPREFPPNVKVILSCITEKFDAPDGDEEKITSPTGSAGTPFKGGSDSAPSLSGKDNDSQTPPTTPDLTATITSSKDAQTSPPLKGDQGGSDSAPSLSGKDNDSQTPPTTPDLTETKPSTKDAKTSPPLKGDQGGCSPRTDPILAAFDHWPHKRVEIQPLTPKERFEIATEVPSISAKKLAPTQMQALLDNPATENPLFLIVALEELRGFGSFEQLDRKIADFPREGDTVTALFTQVIKRLEQDFNPEDVHDVLTLFAAARKGLSEKELEDLLEMRDCTKRVRPGGRDGTVPISQQSNDLFPVLRQIRAYLQRRGDRLDFFHRNFFKAARARYLDSDDKQRAAHARLADYLNTRWREPWQHALEDLPWHRIQAEQWHELIGDVDTPGVLTDLLFIQAKCEAGLVSDLMTDYNEALIALPEFREEVERNRVRDNAMQEYNRAMGAYAVWRYGWWQQKEQGRVSPEPVYPHLPEALEAEGRTSMPEEQSARAARLRHYANFLSSHLKLFSEPTYDILSAAYNYVEGTPVFDDATSLLKITDRLVLRRTNRSPAPLFRPLCPLILQGKPNEIVIISPDGEWAVSKGHHEIRLWDLVNGICLRTLKFDSSLSLELNFTCDGRCVVLADSVGEETTLHLWDLEGGAFYPAPAGLMDRDRTVPANPKTYGIKLIIDKGIGEADAFKRTAPLASQTLSVSPDGRYAVSTGSNHLRVWNLETGACLRTIQEHTSVDGVCVSPDGHHVISWTDDGTIHVWDVKTGQCLRIFRSDRVTCLCVSPDGRSAVSLSGESLNLWDIESGSCLCTLELERGIHYFSVTFCLDGHCVILFSQDGIVQFWDLNSGVCLRTLHEQTEWLTSVSVSSDRRRAVSGSTDGTLRVWDLATDWIPNAFEGHKGPVRSISLTGHCAISANRDGTVRLWDLDSGTCKLPFRHERPIISGALFCPDGRRVLLIYLIDCEFWDLKTDKLLRTFRARCGRVLGGDICLSGRYAIAGTHGWSVELWDLETGANLFSNFDGELPVFSVDFSPDGYSAISGTKKLNFWDLTNGTCRRKIEIVGKRIGLIASLKFSPDGRRAMSGHSDGTSRLWDLKSGTCLLVLEGHKDIVWGVSICSDGHHAYSASSDKTVRLWDLESGLCLAIYYAGSSVRCIADSPKGDHIVCGTEDGQIHILTPSHHLPYAPLIVTPVRQWLFGDIQANQSNTAVVLPGRWDEHLTCRCPHCISVFLPPKGILDTIKQYTSKLQPSTSPCLDLPDAAFDDPRLLVPCPHCGGVLKFNPFIGNAELGMQNVG